MGGAMFSKSLIQFSVDGYVPSLLFGLRPNCVGGNEDNGESEVTHPVRLFVTPWTVAQPAPSSGLL